MSRLGMRRRFPTLGEVCDEPNLPTYRTVAAVLERRDEAPMALVGWTVARSVLIIAPMIVVGVKPSRAIMGGLISATLISALALLRVARASDGVVPSTR